MGAQSKMYVCFHFPKFPTQNILYQIWGAKPKCNVVGKTMCKTNFQAPYSTIYQVKIHCLLTDS